MSSPLPQPVTRTDELLVVVCHRLGEILDRLPVQGPAKERDDGAVELREPEVKPSAPPEGGGESGTPLPRPARKPAASRKPGPRPRGARTT